jgi:hypothetical protein
MRVLSITQQPNGDWLVTFDGPKMRRVQVTHRGIPTTDELRQISDLLEPRMTKLPSERAD